MNLLRITNNILKFLPVMLVILVFTSCKDESKAPVVTFDSAGKGAYIKLVADSETGSVLMNLLSQALFDASSFGYSVEFVDGAGGTRVRQYVLTVEYQDATGVNSAGPVALKTYDASSFTPAASGNLGVAGIVFTSADFVGPFGLTYADINLGDNFVIRGSVVTDDGTWSSSNSSATVRGTAFQGFFDFTMRATCPSDIGGAVNVSTVPWCGGLYTGTSNLKANGSNGYTVDDFAMGAYDVCYYGGPTPDGGKARGSLVIQDACGRLFFLGTDQWGETWTMVNGALSNGNATFTYDWSNTYAPEAGTTSLTRQSGTWPSNLRTN